MVSPKSDLSHVCTDPAAPSRRRRRHGPRVALRRSLLRRARSGSLSGSLGRPPGRVLRSRSRAARSGRTATCRGTGWRGRRVGDGAYRAPRGRRRLPVRPRIRLDAAVRRCSGRRPGVVASRHRDRAAGGGRVMGPRPRCRRGPPRHLCGGPGSRPVLRTARLPAALDPLPEALVTRRRAASAARTACCRRAGSSRPRPGYRSARPRGIPCRRR